MTLWIGNGAVLKSASQWQLKKMKINNSWPKLLVPYRQAEGDFRFALCPSVSPSVRQSVNPSVRLSVRSISYPDFFPKRLQILT